MSIDRAWSLSNTTVRSATRLPDGLAVLAEPQYVDAMVGAEYEKKLAKALGEAGVVSEDPDVSIARKWRSALEKLGFLWASSKSRKGLDTTGSELGHPLTVTTAGINLLQSENLQSRQEVMLRSLAALQLPSPIERGYSGFESFLPLKFAIDVLLGLMERGEEGKLNPIEIETVLVLNTPEDGLEHVVDEIISVRTRRATAINKKKFDNQERTNRATSIGKYGNGATFKDYRDVICRYLRSTGLFRAAGRGITIAPERLGEAKMLSQQLQVESDPVIYLEKLAFGAVLPTDNLEDAKQVLNEIIQSAKSRNVKVDLSGFDLNSVTQVRLARFKVESLIQNDKEEEFASSQSGQLDEIIEYMKVLDNAGRATPEQKEKGIEIPSGEGPAYFEWVLWRVLLALNHTVTPAHQIRNFSVDLDLLPTGHAVGGDADLVVEYEDRVLVVEVTLLTNSRQEGAEGEPVRRHVAKYQEHFQTKPVYGLFVAKKIDTNTAETFRTGIWYLPNDEKIELCIAPLTLKQLIIVLECSRNSIEMLSPKQLFQMIDLAVSEEARELDAPQWKNRIEELTENLQPIENSPTLL